MRKLRLDLDEVKIESFEIEGIPSERGTVRGQQECGDPGFDDGGCRCSCRCCCCSHPPCCCACCGEDEA